MENQTEEPKKKFYTRWWFWVLVVIIIFWIIASAGNNNSNSTAPTPVSTQSTSTTKTPLTSFGDGTYVVETDIQPGTYHTSGGEDCYYKRLSGFGGTDADIIAIENPDGPAIVTIAATDKGFLSANCGTWTLMQLPVTKTKKATSVQQPATIPASAPVVAPAPTPAPQTDNQNTSPVSSETVSQQNAVKSAQSYLSYTAFSHDGLVAQLEYDQFSNADAVYGADNSGADWNAQAAAAAKQYMSYSAFSRGSLITQLEYDKFTEAQAEYGANAVGL